MNSDLYDHPALYDALLPARAHVPYYVNLARQASGDVLELACGTGQLTVAIAGAGLPAVGLDLSAPMLSAAKERAAARRVSVEYVLGDMRNFDLGRKFALIFVARNSLLHLHSTEDLLTAFAAIWRLEGSSLSTSSIRMYAYSRGLQASAFPSLRSKRKRSACFRSRRQRTMMPPRRWVAAVGTSRPPETRTPGSCLSICETFFRRSCHFSSQRAA